MILIDTTTLRLCDFPTSDQRYAILSHTWLSAGEEVSYDEMMASERSVATMAKPGYDKIKRTCELACDNYGLSYAWVDTCCINKASSAELTEAINSMYRWYKDAQICFAYLSDLTEDPSSFQQSRWFTRGWTLQELIAPKDVVFYDRDWNVAGTKETQADDISDITGIPEGVLAQTWELEDVPIAGRFSWASTRQTTREEDQAYSLLGIFDVNMPMLYGEGKKAFLRLQEHIISQSDDLSIFMWTDSTTSQEFAGIFAPSPACFLQMDKIYRLSSTTVPNEFYSTNRGVRLKLPIAWDTETGLVKLPLAILPSLNLGHRLEGNGGIYLRKVGTDLFVRVRPNTCVAIDRNEINASTITVVRSLSKSRSMQITHNVIRVSVPQELVNDLVVEPQGTWDPQTQSLYGGSNNIFVGFMKFRQSEGVVFAILFVSVRGMWHAQVRSGAEVASLEQAYHDIGAKHTSPASHWWQPGDDEQIAHIRDENGSAISVRAKGSNEVEIRIVKDATGDTSVGSDGVTQDSNEEHSNHEE